MAISVETIRTNDIYIECAAGEWSCAWHFVFPDESRNFDMVVSDANYKNYYTASIYKGVFEEVIFALDDIDVEHLTMDIRCVRDECDLRRVILKYMMLHFNDILIEVRFNDDKS